MSSKKPLRPDYDPEKFREELLRSQTSYLSDSELMVESAASDNRQYLQLPLHKILTNATANTRTLPIRFERFLQIEWPSVDDPAYRVRLREIVHAESINPKYTVLSALRFYEKVYLLAKDVRVVGLSQPIGVVEVSPNEYALVWGQRRFMATWVARGSLIDSVIFMADIKNQRMISHIQDSENDLRDAPLLCDRIEAKRSKWIEFTSTHVKCINRDLFDYMGVNRTDGSVLVKLFTSCYEDEYMELIKANKYPALANLRGVDFNHPPGSAPSTAPGKKQSRNVAPSLRNLGVNLHKTCEIDLLKFFVETVIKAEVLAEEKIAVLKKLDLTSMEDLNLALRNVADTIYAK